MKQKANIKIAFPVSISLSTNHCLLFSTFTFILIECIWFVRRLSYCRRLRHCCRRHIHSTIWCAQDTCAMLDSLFSNHLKLFTLFLSFVCVCFFLLYSFFICTRRQFSISNENVITSDRNGIKYSKVLHIRYTTSNVCLNPYGRYAAMRFALFVNHIGSFSYALIFNIYLFTFEFGWYGSFIGCGSRIFFRTICTRKIRHLFHACYYWISQSNTDARFKYNTCCHFIDSTVQLMPIQLHVYLLFWNVLFFLFCIPYGKKANDSIVNAILFLVQLKSNRY